MVSARYRCPIFVCDTNKSDVEDDEKERVDDKGGNATHASSNDLMAFLIPSAPRASVPYGSLDEPEILLSSETRSDSSLSYVEEANAKGISGASHE